MAEHDVEREEAGVGEREDEAERLAADAHAGQQVDAGHGEHERRPVAPRPRAQGREDDHGQELDRGDRAQRQPVDREVEAAVHDREDRAQRDQQRVAQERPRPPPGREHHGRRRDPQPARAQRPDAREEQDRERRAEVVEHRAAHEPGVRRQPVDERCAASAGEDRGRHHAAPCPPVSTRYSGDRRHYARTTFGSTAGPDEPAAPHALQAEARLSLAELGRRVGLTAPAVGERLARLEEAGVIRGYHADVDPRALGYELSVILRIRPGPLMIPKVAELAQRTPEITECHRVTGDDCFIMRVHVRDVIHLEEVIDRFVAYGQTTTSIMQSSPVPGRGPAVAE